MRLVSFIVLLLGCLATTSSATGGRTPPGAAIEQVSMREDCGGVFQAADQVLRAPDDYLHDFGYFVLRMSSSYPENRFDYVVELLDVILPTMVDVLGAPVSLDTLTLIFDNTEIQHYQCGSRIISMDWVHIGGGSEFDISWDNVFIHELTHAFQDDLLCRGFFPSWLTEAFAETARYIVSEMVTQRTGRDVRYRKFDERMAAYDLTDYAGEQVLGGTGGIAWRVEFDLLYRNAAGALTVPMMAQLAAGLDTPHPLNSLSAALREEVNGPPPVCLFDAFDQAWSAPIDGMSPPSRWMRSRAYTCQSVRNGEFLAVIPAFWYNNVSPKKVRVLQFTRTYSRYEIHVPSGRISYTGADGVTHTVPLNYDWPPVPYLHEGAYLVEVESSGQDGTPMHARSWILNVDQPFAGDLLWEGVAVVFVDGDGRPVDIPKHDLSVNGRITARVPGGVIALPHSGNLGTLTFTQKGRVIGTVTSTGDLPRLVVLPVVETTPRPVVTWIPYRPQKGGEVTVTFRRDLSSLAPDGPPEIQAVLCDMGEVIQDQVVMTESAGEPGVYTAGLDVPADMDFGVLSFEDGESKHVGWPPPRYGWFLAYEFEARTSGGPGVLASAFTGTSLVVAFEGDVDPAHFLLKTASDPGGPWTDRPDTPVHKPEKNQLSWDMRRLIGSGTYVQVVATGGAQNDVLLTQYLSPTPTAIRLAAYLPFPNPSAGAVRWPINVLSPVDAVFEVYDVAGRLVHSQGPVSLYPGVEVFRWDGLYRGRFAPAGVYFLRVQSSGYEFTRKIVIVR